MKKFISWNVNGLRACMGKGFVDFVAAEAPDLLALQETKMQRGQADVPLEGYFEYWNSAERPGYSGTAVFAREEPLCVAYGMAHGDALDGEGRVLTLEYPEFYFVTAYSPNAQEELKRLDVRMRWEDAFRAYLTALDQKKPVIVCGDLNVAHREIDLKNPKSNRRNAGFTDEERGKLTELLEAGFVDSFRFLYPDAVDAYSWWSYRFNAREKNVGWRIDYFLTSERIKENIADSLILSHVYGSDHCPVSLLLEL